MNAADRDLSVRSERRRWRADDTRLQLVAELAGLIDDAPQYDTLLERSASVIAHRSDGGCVIALLTADAQRLHPLGVDHPSDEARDALERFVAGNFSPVPPLVEEVLVTGHGRRIETGADLSGHGPGLRRYVELTGRRHAVLVPLRAGGRSVGVLWAPSHGELADDDVAFFEFVGAQVGLAAEHARLADTARPPTVARGDERLSVLTAREREVLALVAVGLTSREVAEQLVLSQRTVEWHRSRLAMKLGASGRAALTRLAREAGLIDDGSGSDSH